MYPPLTMSPFIAQTPTPPYFVVVFTIVPFENLDGYEEMAERMVELASQQPGFLGMEYAATDVELTISYWETLEAISHWRNHVEHIIARDLGRQKWFQSFKVRIAQVVRDYEFTTA